MAADVLLEKVGKIWDNNTLGLEIDLEGKRYIAYKVNPDFQNPSLADYIIYVRK